MTGSILHLASVGAQDVYLTGNPQVTNFKKLYKRHTNFTVESIEQLHAGHIDFGKKISFTINRKADLVSSMFLEVDILYKNQIVYERTGLALIDKVELEIGGIVINDHYNKWLNIWTQLIYNKEQYKKFLHMVQGSIQDTSLDGEIIHTSNNSINKIVKYYIPLYFWFNRDVGYALPLLCLQYNEVKINVTFTKKSLLFTENSTSNSTFESVKLFCDYIFLDVNERRTFLYNKHEYLIDQVQHKKFPVELRQGNNHLDLKLNFNHPCKEIIWELGYNTFHHESLHYSLISTPLNSEFALPIPTSGKLLPFEGGSIIMEIGGSIHSSVVGEDGSGLSLIDGIHRNVDTQLKSGTGSGLTVDVTVSGGLITKAIVNNPGSGYDFDLVTAVADEYMARIDVTNMISSGTPGFSDLALVNLKLAGNAPYYYGSSTDLLPDPEQHGFTKWSGKNISIRNTGTNRFNGITDSSFISFDSGTPSTETRDLRSPRIDLTYVESIEITFEIGRQTVSTYFQEFPDNGDKESLYFQFSDIVDWDNDNTFTTNITTPANFTTVTENQNGNQNKTIQLYKAVSTPPSESDALQNIKLNIPLQYRKEGQYIRVVQGERTLVTGDNYAIYDIKFNYQKKRYFDNNYHKYFQFGNVHLQYDNMSRVSERNSSYFNTVQSYYHHNGNYVNNINNNSMGNFYTYSFALYPDNHQPSGTCNFSRIDNPVLKLDITGSKYIFNKVVTSIDVYVVNYNILQIEGGMANVVYKN